VFLANRDFGENLGKKQPVFTKELVKLSVTNAVKKLFGEVKAVHSTYNIL
jgi:hypothetical protein